MTGHATAKALVPFRLEWSDCLAIAEASKPRLLSLADNRSPAEMARLKWVEIGLRLGFDGNLVKPHPNGDQQDCLAYPVEPKDWHIYYNPKPIPTRNFDWDFYHDDFDGADDSGDTRCGSVGSWQAAVAEIRTIEEELSDAKA